MSSPRTFIRGWALLVADLTDADDVEKLSAQVGMPDFLINVAGGPVAPSREQTLPSIAVEAACAWKM